MKFYYNGNLIRTSKTHEYRYALLFVREDGTYRALRCSAERKSCVQEFDRRTRAEQIAKQTGMTIDEVWNSRKYPDLWSDQLYRKDELIVVELERRP